MWRQGIAAGALVLALAAVPAGAVTLVTPDGKEAQPYQRWADRSLAPTIAGPITLHVAACPYEFEPSPELRVRPIIYGCAMPDGRLYLDPVTRLASRPDRADLLMHELGHHFDYATLDIRSRRRLLRLLGLSLRRKWNPGPTYPRSPAEKFAEGYMFCARYRLREYRLERTFPNNSGYRLRLWRHRRVCRAIRRVADQADGTVK